MLKLQSVIMILSVTFKKKKRKGDCEESALLILYHSVFLSCSVSLLLALSLTPSSAHILCEKVSLQQINCIVTCHFKGKEAQHADA